MLKSIRLQNFFGFQDCTINLEKGANVLVGINGSGKSNFFKAVKLLRQLPKSDGIADILYSEFGGLENIVFSSLKNTNKENYITIEVKSTELIEELENESFDYSVSIKPSKSRLGNFFLQETLHELSENGTSQELVKWKGGNLEFLDIKTNEFYDPEIKTKRLSILSPENIENSQYYIANLRRIFKDLVYYDSFDTTKGSIIRKPNQPSIDKFLLPDCSNLASLLSNFKISNKASYILIVSALKKVNERYNGIEFNQASPGFLDLWLDEEGLNRAIPAIHISDGTLKFLCLMAILYNPNRGSVVCIDEPELGLHPDMINTLHEAIEFAAETSQVIISTHSAHLLNYFDLEQVRVFEKDENNATIVEQYSKADFEGWQQKFQTGKMWREGSIGGKRW